MKTNKVIVITGSSSGIGLTTANFLCNKGYKVYGVARREFQSDKFETYQGDVCNRERMNEIFKDIYAREGKIDVLINNAGMGISGAIEYVTDKDLDTIFEVNAKAVIKNCSLILPYLRESKGKIINISSVAAPISIPFQACYSATKSAVETFSLALSNEVKKQGIKISCIRPGDTKTGFTAARVKTDVQNDVYGDKIVKSVKKMEKDEQNGKDPVTVSKVVYKCIKKKNPPLVCTVGFGYKFICFLSKFLPTRFVNFVVSKLY